MAIRWSSVSTARAMTVSPSLCPVKISSAQLPELMSHSRRNLSAYTCKGEGRAGISSAHHTFIPEQDCSVTHCCQDVLATPTKESQRLDSPLIDCLVRHFIWN